VTGKNGDHFYPVHDKLYPPYRSQPILKQKRFLNIPTLATVAVTIAAIIHVLISVVEIFFWKTPVIYEGLGFTAEVARQAAPIRALQQLHCSRFVVERIHKKLCSTIENLFSRFCGDRRHF